MRISPARQCPTGCGRTASAAEIMCRPCWRTLTEEEEEAFLVMFERYKAHPENDEHRLAMELARKTVIAEARRHITPQLELGG